MKQTSNTGAESVQHEIDFLLSKADDPQALAKVMALAYSELRYIAHHHFAKESPACTLQPTELVHEAYLRVLKDCASFKNHHYFYAAASQTMRRILVENARKRRSEKRGGKLTRIDFSDAERLGFERTSDLLAFESALRRLEQMNPKLAKVVVWRVFSGLTPAEIALGLGMGQSTARKHWATARRWLRTALEGNAA